MKLPNEPIPAGPEYIKMLFAEYHERIYLAAFRISGNTQDAEDVLQSIFLGLLNRSEIPDMGIAPINYLCRAAINASLDILRTKRRTRDLNLKNNFDEIESSGVIAEDELYQKEIRQQLRYALADLNSRAAEIFTLRYFEEFSNTDIAKILGTSSSSVAVELHRTRNRLQELLREFEGESL